MQQGNKKLEKKLDRIFEKIGLLLDAYTDDPDDPRDSADKAVNFAEWTGTMLAVTDNLGISRDSIYAEISLSARDYITLLNLGMLGDDIKTHLRAAAKDETTRLSASQLASICFAASETLVDATKAEQERLNGVAAKVAGLLTESLTKAITEGGRAKHAQAKRERRARKKATGPKGEVATTRSIKLTQAQRRIIAETKPDLASRLKLDERNQRTIQLTLVELQGIQATARDAAMHAETGMKRNSLRHVVTIATNAIEGSEV